jgi:predicted XRE-type DNA-binding protein
MKSFKIMVTTLFLLLAITAVEATELRIVILPKMTVEGKERDSANLEMEVTNTLRQRDMRVVELSTALQAQKAALSDLVNEGKVPKELSVMNADALLAVQVSCDQSSGGIMGSNLKSWFCVFNTKVIRVDSGDVIHGSSKNFTAPGLNALQAVSNAIKKNVGKETDSYAESWSKSWSNEGKWSLDLIITGVAQKKKVDEINSSLKSVEGVKNSQVVMFKKDLSKITVSGEGADNFSKLRDALDSDQSLSLRVNYEAGRVIHAEFDFGQAYSRSVNSFVSIAGETGKKSMGAIISERGPDLLTSYLMNLDYLDINNSELLKSDKKKAVAEAKKSNIPLVLFAELIEKNDEWLSIIELVFSSDGKKVSVVQGKSSDPFEAMNKAVAALDEGYRKSVTKGDFRKKLNLSKDAEGLATASKLKVQKLDVSQIFPSIIGYYRKNGIGTIDLENTSKDTLSHIEITYKMGENVVGTAKIDELKPKASVSSKIMLDVLPESDKGFSQIQAQITFQAGDVYGRRDAYAPLIVHTKNIIDWSNPRSIASFIDPANKMVRDVATAVVTKAKIKDKSLVTKQLFKAAVVFESLWHKPMKYVSDPVATSFDSNIDDVQFPAQTLERLAGDCDDLTVLLASLYESIGLATVIITTPGHVFLGVESGVLAGGNVLFDLPDSLFVEVDGAFFIPVEATAIGDTFAQAWFKGADILNKAGKDYDAFRTRDAWKEYPNLSVSSKSNNLKPKEVKVENLNKLIADVRKETKDKTVQWAKALHEKIVKGEVPDIKTDLLKKDPVAKSVVLWLGNKRDKAIEEAAALCSKGMVEACYNMTVMSMYDALESGDMQTVNANMTKNHYSDAISMLPPNVINMLSDNGGLGMGDEASKESETRKRIAEVLSQARKKAEKKSSASNVSKEIKTSHVGGRKASDANESAGATAEMFFWDTVKKKK